MLKGVVTKRLNRKTLQCSLDNCLLLLKTSILSPNPPCLYLHIWEVNRISWVQHLAQQSNFFDVWFYHKRGQWVRQKIKSSKQIFLGWDTHFKSILLWQMCEVFSSTERCFPITFSLLIWWVHFFHLHLTWSILKCSLCVGTLILSILCTCCKSILIENQFNL